MKKVFLVLALFLMILVPQVQALTYENVIALNNSDTYKGGSPRITGNGTKDVTITFNAAQLKIVESKADVGRTIDAAWLGVRVVAPKDIEISTLKSATYKNGGSTVEKSFWSSQDSAKSENKEDTHYIDVFGAITEDILKNATKEGKLIKYSWIFDWDNDKTDDQTVTIVVDPKNVTLTALDSDTVLWNEKIYNDLKPAEATKNPETGDNLIAYIGLSVIGFISGGLVFGKLRKN